MKAEFAELEEQNLLIVGETGAQCVLYIYMRTIVKGMLVVMHSVKYYFLTMQLMHHLLFIPRYHPKMKYMHRSRTKTSHYLNAFPPKHVDDISHKGNGICLNTR